MSSHWAQLARRLGAVAGDMVGDQHAVLIIDVGDSDHFVQWHGEPDEEFYAEASSGLYAGEPLPMARQAQLHGLGWAAPGDGWGAGACLNWSRHWLAPVNLDDVVTLTVRTLREVYHAEITDLAVRR